MLQEIQNFLFIYFKITLQEKQDAASQASSTHFNVCDKSVEKTQ